MMDDVLNAYGSRFLIAAGGVFLALAVLVVVLWILKNRAPSPFVRGGRNRQPRLQVLDAAAVDARRRLVLVRRDNIEHLILIGGPTDVVVESGIGEPKAYLTGELAAQEALARSQALARMQDLPKTQEPNALASRNADEDAPVSAAPSVLEAPTARSEIQPERREIPTPTVATPRRPVPVSQPAEAAVSASTATPPVAAPDVSFAERPAAQSPSRPQPSPQAVPQPAPAVRPVTDRPAAQVVEQEARSASDVKPQPVVRAVTPGGVDREEPAAPEEKQPAALNVQPQAPQTVAPRPVPAPAPRQPEPVAPPAAPVEERAVRAEVASPAQVSSAPAQAVPEIEPPASADRAAASRSEAVRAHEPAEKPTLDIRADRISNPAPAVTPAAPATSRPPAAAETASPSPARPVAPVAGDGATSPTPPPVERRPATTPQEAGALLDAARDRVLKSRVEPFSAERYKAPAPEDDIDLLTEPTPRHEPSAKPEPDIEALKSEFEKILDGEVLTQPSARPRPTVEPPVARAIPPMNIPPAARPQSAAATGEAAKPEGNLQDEIARIFGDMGAPRKD